MKNINITLVLLLITSTILAQTFVSTAPENRNVILEEFTGINCPACPGGHSQSQGLYDNNPGDVFVINIHTGSLAEPGPGEPDYRIDPTGNDLMWATVPGATGIGFPCGTINRHEFLFGSAPTPQQGAGTFAYSQSDWPVLVSQVLNEPSPVNIGIQANADANNNLVVDVEIYYTGSQTVNSNFLHVAVIQNDIIENPMIQAGGSSNSLWYDAATGTYTQQHMLRHMMTGTWGEEINTISSGTFVQKQYLWQLPSNINGINLDPSKLSVVAFVSESSREVISGNEKKVSSAGWIAPSWDCNGGACIDPGTGNGFYSSEQQCIDNCNITATWNCTYSGSNQGACVDPGNGTGNYSDSISCEQSCIRKSYNCTGTGIACVDPGDESGSYPTLAGCLFICGINESYNCVNGHCNDPGDGSGTYSTMSNCINDGCLPPLNITEYDNLNIKIFPNPAKNKIFIDGQCKNITIYNGYGDLIFNAKNINEINISNFKNGLYFIEISTQNSIGIKKLIISK